MPTSSKKINVELEAQWYIDSCWAACLSMAAKALKPCRPDLDQCKFINSRPKVPDRCCVKRNFDPIKGEIIVTSTNPDCDETRLNVGLLSLDKLTDLAQLILPNQVHMMESRLRLKQVEKKLNDGKPIIHFFGFGQSIDDNNRSAGSHIVLISRVLKIKNRQNKFKTLLEVKDPWPMGVGSEYLMTYEAYAVQRLTTNKIAAAATVYFGSKLPDPPLPTKEDIFPIPKFFVHSDPKQIVGKLLSQLQNLKNTADSTSFLRLAGLEGVDLQNIRVLDSWLSVAGVNTEKPSVNQNDQIFVADLENVRDFEERMFFLTIQEEIKTAIVVAKHRDSAFGEDFFLHSIENGAKYNALLPQINSSNEGEKTLLKSTPVSGKIQDMLWRTDPSLNTVRLEIS